MAKKTRKCRYQNRHWYDIRHIRSINWCVFNMIWLLWIVLALSNLHITTYKKRQHKPKKVVSVCHHRCCCRRQWYKWAWLLLRSHFLVMNEPRKKIIDYHMKNTQWICDDAWKKRRDLWKKCIESVMINSLLWTSEWCDANWMLVAMSRLMLLPVYVGSVWVTNELLANSILIQFRLNNKWNYKTISPSFEIDKKTKIEFLSVFRYLFKMINRH